VLISPIVHYPASKQTHYLFSTKILLSENTMAYVISAGWIGGGFGSVPAWLKCSVGIQGPPKRPYFSAWSTRATILLIMVGIIIFLFPRGRASNNVLQPERHSSNLG